MLSALSPIFLLGIPASILFLILIYKNRSKFKTINVGTHFLLNKLSKTTSKKTFFKLPIRFFIDLLILSLFFLIFSKLFLNTKSNVKTLVLDNSFSTNAYQASGFKRIDEIKAKANQLINNNKNKLFNIYISSPKLTLIAQKKSSSLAKRAIGKVNSHSSNLEITEVLEKLENRDITFITDRVAKGKSNVKVISVFDKPLNNITLSEIEIENSKNIAIKIYNFGKEKKAILNLYDNNNELIRQKEVKLKNKVNLETLGLEKKGNYKLKVSSSSLDSIKEDNSLEFKFNIKGKNIGVVSSRSLEEMGLTNISTYNFIKLLNEKSSENVLFKIIDLTSRANINNLREDQNLLFNLPKSDSKYWQIKGTSNNIDVSYWNKSDKILNYLNFSDLKFNSSLIFKPKELAISLIESQAGVHLLRRNFNKNKIIVSGFDLFPINLKEKKFTSILALNIFKDLANEASVKIKLNLNEDEYDTFKAKFISFKESTLKNSETIVLNYNITDILIRLLIFILVLDIVYLISKFFIRKIRNIKFLKNA